MVSGAALLLDTFKNGLRLREDVAEAYLRLLSEARGAQAHHAIDLWFLFCVHGTPQFRTKVERTLKAKAGTGCIVSSFLRLTKPNQTSCLRVKSGRSVGRSVGLSLHFLFD